METSSLYLAALVYMNVLTVVIVTVLWKITKAQADALSKVANTNLGITQALKDLTHAILTRTI